MTKYFHEYEVKVYTISSRLLFLQLSEFWVKPSFFHFLFRSQNYLNIFLR